MLCYQKIFQKGWKTVSILAYPKKRLELLRRIRESGYGVRMHAYEYYVWKKGFVSIIFLQPQFRKAYIYTIQTNQEESREAVKRISSLLKIMDENLNIEVIE